MKNHLVTVLAIAFSAITCGATFLFALYRQLAMVEVTASLVTGIELYFLSSSIGDWIERKMGPNWVRLGVALGLAAGVVGYFLIAKHMHPLSAG
jgi:hypothetical protein